MTGFWFDPESPRPLAAMRIGLAIVVLWDVCSHAPFAVESYSTAGRPLPLVGWLRIPSPTVAVLLHGVLIGSLIAAGVGLLTCLSLVLAFVLLGWFALLDFPDTLNKYTAIALHLLPLLAVSGANHVWSLDRRWFGPHDHTRLVPAWPRRLMQLLVCHVYLGAAITKMRMRDFATGDVLGFSLIDDRWAGGWLGSAPGAWLATQPRLLVLASFATLAFEFAFPLLVWFERTRRPMLVVAVLFHLALACTLDLRVFTPIMLVALLSFVREDDLRWLGAMSSGHGTSRRWTLACGTWAAVVLGAGAASLLAHRVADPYGVFTAREPTPLTIVPREDAERMLAGDSPDPAMLVHRIDVGSRYSHFHVFGENRRFRHGDVVHVLLRFQQRHEPLAVRTILVAPDGNEAEPIERIVMSEQTHLLLQLRMAEGHALGEYVVRIEIGGEPVGELTFDLE